MNSVYSFLGAGIGALLGGTVAALTAFFLARRNLKLKLFEKILDRRIEAHEQVIYLSKLMRTMVPVDNPAIPSEETFQRSPGVFINRNMFDDFHAKVGTTVGFPSHWLRTKVVHEINFLQDYILNLLPVLNNIPENLYLSLGVIIREDFTDMSKRLEDYALEFFSYDMKRLKILPPKSWHKYPKEVTLKRLNETLLVKEKQKIEQLLQIKLA